MMRSFLQLVLPLTYLFFLSLIFSSPKIYGYSWAAFGEIRGGFEPCGCDPSSDVGGLRRAGAFVEQVRKKDKLTDVFVLGHLNDPKKSGQDINANILVQGVKSLSITAGLPMSKDDLETFVAAKIPPVLTNSLLPSTVRFLKSRDTCVLGFVSPKEGFSGPLNFLNEDLAKLCSSTSRRVLLTAVSDKELTDLAEVIKPDLILRSSERDISVKPDGSEMSHAATLAEVYAGAPSYRIPLGASGVWVSKNLQRGFLGIKNLLSEEKPESSNFLKFGSTSEKDNSIQSEGLPIVWLGKDYATLPSPVDKAMKLYNKAEKQKFDEHVKAKMKFRSSSQYKGSETCQRCHQKEYDIWKRSDHSDAVHTLKAAQKQEHSSCIGCHVVGYEKNGGYLNQKLTPHLAGVGCESCHGAGKEHAKNPKMNRLEGGKFVCAECHVTPHSPKFDFDTYWEKIKHGTKKNPTIQDDQPL